MHLQIGVCYCAHHKHVICSIVRERERCTNVFIKVQALVDQSFGSSSATGVPVAEVATRAPSARPPPSSKVVVSVCKCVCVYACVCVCVCVYVFVRNMCVYVCLRVSHVCVRVHTICYQSTAAADAFTRFSPCANVFVYIRRCVDAVCIVVDVGVGVLQVSVWVLSDFESVLVCDRCEHTIHIIHTRIQTYTTQTFKHVYFRFLLLSVYAHAE